MTSVLDMVGVMFTGCTPTAEEVFLKIQLHRTVPPAQEVFLKIEAPTQGFYAPTIDHLNSVFLDPPFEEPP